MLSFSLFRPNSTAAKRSIRRSLPGIGLLACAVAVAGTGCGGGTKYGNNDNDGSGGGIVSPIVSGDAPFTKSAGTRGTIPFAVYPFSFTTLSFPKTLLVSPTKSVRLSFPTSSTFAVPDLYADRQFDHFELNGTSIGTGTQSVVLARSLVDSIALTSLPPTTGGTLTAVYKPFNPGAGVPFAENYNVPANARWDSMPIKVFIDPASTPNDGVRQRLKEAINKWSDASGGIISLQFVSEDGSADISLSTGDSLSFNDTDEFTTLAVTFTTYKPGLSPNGYRRLKKANIYFLPEYFNLPNATDQRQFESIAAHEFGHALGILSDDATSGHSPNQEDLMCATVNFVTGEITEHDIATIANIYRPEYDAAAP